MAALGLALLAYEKALKDFFLKEEEEKLEVYLSAQGSAPLGGQT